MKLIIFEGSDKETIETAYNEFAKNNDIKFSPLSVTPYNEGVIYTMSVYYEPKIGIEAREAAKRYVEKEEQKSKTKPCPNCGDLIPKSWQFHAKCKWKGDGK